MSTLTQSDVVICRFWLGLSFKIMQFFTNRPSFSDHNPLLLQLQGSSSLGSPIAIKRFKFEASWTRSEDCAHLINYVWSRSSGSDLVSGLVSKLAECGEVLLCWSKSTFGDRRRRKQELEKEIGYLEGLPLQGSVFSTLTEKQKELEGIIVDNETRWKQRAKAYWLAEGTGTQNFFMPKPLLVNGPIRF
ncbi:hypothetical protein Salat_0655900 [Sesamum alatum]|uniref:Reverse transcriptase n=1 Tax=Sesamum alatum TaxID=300844 RepID=A0AAE2CUU0_9LAMI|nr:hypothetical protein Salat_0655900 [Sesamum alatum]